jgi:hypothetical protein
LGWGRAAQKKKHAPQAKPFQGLFTLLHGSAAQMTGITYNYRLLTKMKAAWQPNLTNTKNTNP